MNTPTGVLTALENLQAKVDDLTQRLALAEMEAYAACGCGFRGTLRNYNQHDCARSTARAESREAQIEEAIALVEGLIEGHEKDPLGRQLALVLEALEAK
jgi:hypothetical protein